MIQIKLAKSPGPIVELMLEDNTTLAGAIKIAESNRSDGVTFGGDKFTYTRAGACINTATVLCNGDTVLAYENLKGAMPMVKVGRVPGTSIEFVAPDGISFKQAVAMAVEEGLKKDPPINFNGDLSKTTIRTGGNEVMPDSPIPVSSGTVVIALYENMKGA